MDTVVEFLVMLVDGLDPEAVFPLLAVLLDSDASLGPMQKLVLSVVHINTHVQSIITRIIGVPFAT